MKAEVRRGAKLGRKRMRLIVESTSSYTPTSLEKREALYTWDGSEW